MENAVNYVAAFDARVLDERCVVEVSVPLGTTAGPANVTARFKGMVAKSHGGVTLEQLRALRGTLEVMQRSVTLLTHLPPKAHDHQLSWQVGNAVVILVMPRGKPARFTVTVGPWHREGNADDMPLEALGDAIEALEECAVAASTHVGAPAVRALVDTPAAA